MMLKHVDMSAAMQRLADRKIEQAMQEGKFDQIEGAGKPIDLEPMPADENARLLWWAIRLLRKNDVVPDEIRLRKSIDLARRAIDSAADEATLRQQVGAYNALVRQLNTMGTNRIDSSAITLDVEAEVLRWRSAR